MASQPGASLLCASAPLKAPNMRSAMRADGEDDLGKGGGIVHELGHRAAPSFTITAGPSAALVAPAASMPATSFLTETAVTSRTGAG